MRLLPPLLESPCFNFSTAEELIRALGDDLLEGESREIARLVGMGLPPMTSLAAIATMFGMNQGIVWSFLNRPRKHYRTFQIPKGSGFRRIDAPRIGLKIIQKWMAVILSRAYVAPKHVFGFVSGKDHVLAAATHCGSDWVISVDVKNFFPSTSQEFVAASLVSVGFLPEQATLVSRFSCLDGGLAQGAPSSPVLSNICCTTLDAMLLAFANERGLRVSRYADDVTISGSGEVHFEQLVSSVSDLFGQTPWEIAADKTQILVRPKRLKIHGLVVNGSQPRLTKGYRNKIRAFRHLVSSAQLPEEDLRRMRGHIAYAEGVLRRSEKDPSV